MFKRGPTNMMREPLVVATYTAAVAMFLAMALRVAIGA